MTVDERLEQMGKNFRKQYSSTPLKNIADIINVSENSIRNIRSGHNVSLRLFLLLSEYYGLSPDELLLSTSERISSTAQFLRIDENIVRSIYESTHKTK